MKKNRKLELPVGTNGDMIIRLTADYVAVEMKDKSWKVQFGSKTRDYVVICHIINAKDFKALSELAYLLAYSRLIVQSMSFCDEYHNLVDKYINNQALVEVSKEDDDLILAEEKALTLMTPEAIEELENLKKEKNNEQ